MRPAGSTVIAVTWPANMAGRRDVEQGAPKIARPGLAGLAEARVAMLGTVRPDGSPRISPVEPYLVGGQLLIGAMAWSIRAACLHREPRYVLHSVVTGPTPAKVNSSCTDPRELRTTATRAW